MNATITLNALHADADTTNAYGGKTTDRFNTVRARWDALTATDQADTITPVVDLLTGDTDPTPADLALTLALADLHSLTAKQPVLRAENRSLIAARLLPMQRAEWNTTLADNYTNAAKAYTTAAGHLIAALDLIGDHTEDTVLTAPTKTREAWLRLPTLRDHVDHAADALAFFAHANNIDAGPANLGLYAAIPNTADRRTVWAAIDGDHGPAGLWGTLHALGATLTAPNADSVRSYRRPKPIETRYIRRDLGWAPVDYDPETDQPKGAVPAGGTNVAA